jgi:hypothetical protein
MANSCLSCHFAPLCRKRQLARPVTLALRTMNRHAQLMGWSEHWSDDDYFVLDEGRSVGRIYKEVHGDARWFWLLARWRLYLSLNRNGGLRVVHSGNFLPISSDNSWVCSTCSGRK